MFGKITAVAKIAVGSLNGMTDGRPRIADRRLLAASLLALAPCGVAHAGQLNVCASGCTYSTIQSAVDAAVSGDVIHISSGRYLENVTVAGKGLQFVGDDNATTVIDGNRNGSVVTLGAVGLGTAEPISMSQITITHGLAGNGGGIRILSGVAVTLSGVIVIHNVATGIGGGISVDAPNGPTIKLVHCAIDNNKAGTAGGGIGVERGSLDMQASTITRNAVPFFGGGVFVDGEAALTMNNSSVVDNQATKAHTIGSDQGEGAGLAIWGAGVISDSVIGNNVSAGFSGGIDIRGSATISNSIIARNVSIGTGPFGGAGGIGFGVLELQPNSFLTLSNAYVVQNRAIRSGGIFAAQPIASVHSTIADNYPSDCEGPGCP